MKSIAIKLADGSFHTVWHEGEEAGSVLLTNANGKQSRIRVGLYAKDDERPDYSKNLDTLELDFEDANADEEKIFTFDIKFADGMISTSIRDNESGKIKNGKSISFADLESRNDYEEEPQVIDLTGAAVLYETKKEDSNDAAEVYEMGEEDLADIENFHSDDAADNVVDLTGDVPLFENEDADGSSNPANFDATKAKEDGSAAIRDFSDIKDIHPFEESLSSGENFDDIEELQGIDEIKEADFPLPEIERTNDFSFPEDTDSSSLSSEPFTDSANQKDSFRELESFEDGNDLSLPADFDDNAPKAADFDDLSFSDENDETDTSPNDTAKSFTEEHLAKEEEEVPLDFGGDDLFSDETFHSDVKDFDSSLFSESDTKEKEISFDDDALKDLPDFENLSGDAQDEKFSEQYDSESLPDFASTSSDEDFTDFSDLGDLKNEKQNEGTDDLSDLDELDDFASLPKIDESDLSHLSDEDVLSGSTLSPDENFSLPEGDFSELSNNEESDRHDGTAGDFATPNFNFDGLYDEPGYSDYPDEEKKRSKLALPVIICLLCALICLLATLALLFFIPSKTAHSLKNLQAEADANETLQKGVDILPPILEPKVEEVGIAPKASMVHPKKVQSKKSEDIVYTIKWGDTLWDIASNYYRDPWQYKMLAARNEISDPDYIISGTKIILPAP